MKASCSAIKNKMLELTRLFCVESNLFQKFIIVYQYITLLDKDPITKKILQKIFDNTVKSFGDFGNCLDEDSFLNVKSDVIRTQEFWTYYSNLKIIYSRMKKIKKKCNCLPEEVNDLCNLYSRPYSTSALKLSFKIINSNIFDELDQKCFIEGEDKAKTGLSFDTKKSILYINDFKIIISKQAKQTNDHKILNHIFITNKDNISDDFFYSEIAEDEFGELDYKGRKYNWNKYHRAAVYLNKKIANQTKNEIKNFLIISTGSAGKIKINSKYL